MAKDTRTARRSSAPAPGRSQAGKLVLC